MPVYLHAGSKARDDVEEILASIDGVRKLSFTAPNMKRDSRENILLKLGGHVAAAKSWHEILTCPSGGDWLVVQFPPFNHSLFLYKELEQVKKRGVRLVYLVHDLDCLRLNESESTRSRLWRIRQEEIKLLPIADVLVVHNTHMKEEMLQRNLTGDAMVTVLDIFDYLVSNVNAPWAHAEWGRPVVVAGNLKPEKAGYIYQLPQDLDFNLYGPNFDQSRSTSNSANYLGSFPADELIQHLVGSFGLVWDGNSPDTCSGSYGQYLRINNPHKTSLYLAAGMPVVVWDQAAIADFVRNEGVGICISSLHSLRNAIDAIGEDGYAEMTKRARVIGERLRAGYYTRMAVSRAVEATKC